MATRRTITLTVNGRAYTREVEPRLSLVDCLRDELDLPGTHVGCEQGVCGACTIRLNGATVRACLLFAVQANGAELLTVEGLGDLPPPAPLPFEGRGAPTGEARSSASSPAEGLGAGKSAATAPTGPRLHPLQEAFWTHHGLQCGFCTPGMLLAALELLERDPSPSEDAIRDGISGNLCMCTGYVNIVKAIQSAARVLRGEPPLPPGPEPGV